MRPRAVSAPLRVSALLRAVSAPRCAILAPLLAVALLAAWAGGAAAAPATSVEVRDLARRAASDPAALARLRAVDSVDGRPDALDRALAGARGE